MKRYFIHNGKKYAIPEEKVGDFLKSNPGAQEGKFYEVEGQKYVIPFDKTGEFEKYHNINTEKKNSPAPTPSPSSAGQSASPEPQPATEPRPAPPTEQPMERSVRWPFGKPSDLMKQQTVTGQQKPQQKVEPEVQSGLFSPTQTPKEKVSKALDIINATFAGAGMGSALSFNKDEILNNPEKLATFSKAVDSYFQNQVQQGVAKKQGENMGAQAALAGMSGMAASMVAGKNVKAYQDQAIAEQPEIKEVKKAIIDVNDDLIFDMEPVKQADGTVTWQKRKDPPMKDGRPDYTHGLATLGKERMKVVDPAGYSQMNVMGAHTPFLEQQSKLHGASVRLKGLEKRMEQAVIGDSVAANAVVAYLRGKATPEQIALIQAKGLDRLADEYNDVAKYQQNVKYESPEIRKQELIKMINDEATARFGTSGTKQQEEVLSKKGMGWVNPLMRLMGGGWSQDQIDQIINEYRKSDALAHPVDQRILNEISDGAKAGTVDFNQFWLNEMIDNSAVTFEDSWKSLKRDVPTGLLQVAGKAAEMRYGIDPLTGKGGAFENYVQENTAEIVSEIDESKYKIDKRWSPTETQFFVDEYVDTDPKSPTFMQVVKNNGKKGGFNLGNIAYNSAKQFGQLASQMVTATTVNALTGGGAGFVGSVMLPSFAMVYDQNLKESYDIIGADTKDAWKNVLYAGITSSFEGLSEKFGNPLEQSKAITGLLASGLKKNIANAVRELSEDNLRKMGKDELKTLIATATKETAKAIGKGGWQMAGESIEEFSNSIAQSITQDAFNPDYRQGNMLEDAGKIFLETFASMGFTGVASTAGGMRNAFGSRLSQDAVQMLAENKEKAIQQIEREEGTTREQKDEKIRMLNTISKAYSNSKAAALATMSTTNQKLANKDLKALTMAAANEIDIQRKIDAAKESGDEALVSVLEQKRKHFTDIRKAILEGKIAVDPLTGAPWVAPVEDVDETEDTETVPPPAPEDAEDIMDMIDAQPEEEQDTEEQMPEEAPIDAPVDPGVEPIDFEAESAAYDDNVKQVNTKNAELRKDAAAALTNLTKAKAELRAALGNERKEKTAKEKVDYAQSVLDGINEQISQNENSTNRDNFLKGILARYERQRRDKYVRPDDSLPLEDQITLHEAEITKLREKYDQDKAGYEAEMQARGKRQQAWRMQQISKKKGAMLGNRKVQQNPVQNTNRPTDRVTADQRAEFNYQKSFVDKWLMEQNALIRKAADAGADSKQIIEMTDAVRKEYQKRIHEVAKATLPATKFQARKSREKLDQFEGKYVTDTVTGVAGLLTKDSLGNWIVTPPGKTFVELGKDAVDADRRLDYTPRPKQPKNPSRKGNPKNKGKNNPAINVTAEDRVEIGGIQFRIVSDEKGNVQRLETDNPISPEMQKTVGRKSTLVEVEIQRNRMDFQPTMTETQVTSALEAQGVSAKEQETIDNGLGQLMTETVADILDNGINENTTDAEYLQVELFVESAIKYLTETFPNSDYAKAMIESLQELQKIVDNEYDNYERKRNEPEQQPEESAVDAEGEGIEETAEEEQQEIDVDEVQQEDVEKELPVSVDESVIIDWLRNIKNEKQFRAFKDWIDPKRITEKIAEEIWRASERILEDDGVGTYYIINDNDQFQPIDWEEGEIVFDTYRDVIIDFYFTKTEGGENGQDQEASTEAQGQEDVLIDEIVADQEETGKELPAATTSPTVSTFQKSFKADPESPETMVAGVEAIKELSAQGITGFKDMVEALGIDTGIKTLNIFRGIYGAAAQQVNGLMSRSQVLKDIDRIQLVAPDNLIPELTGDYADDVRKAFEAGLPSDFKGENGYALFDKNEFNTADLLWQKLAPLDRKLIAMASGYAIPWHNESIKGGQLTWYGAQAERERYQQLSDFFDPNNENENDQVENDTAAEEANAETVIEQGEAAINEGEAATTAEEIDDAIESVEAALTATESKIKGLVESYSTEGVAADYPINVLAKSIKKELRAYGKVVAKLLGLELADVSTNIPPAGGEVYLLFNIPGDTSQVVYVQFEYEPIYTAGGGYDLYRPVGVVYGVMPLKSNGKPDWGKGKRTSMGIGNTAGSVFSIGMRNVVGTSASEFSPQEMAKVLAEIMPEKKQATISEVAQNSPNVFIVRPGATPSNTSLPDAAQEVAKTNPPKSAKDQTIEDLKKAWNDLKKPGSTLTMGGLDPVKIEKAVKVVGLAIKLGYLKFRDMVVFLREQFGEEVADLFEEIKAGYSQYLYRHASDAEADQMDEDVSGITYSQINPSYGSENAASGVLGGVSAPATEDVLSENPAEAGTDGSVGAVTGTESGEVRQDDNQLNEGGNVGTGSQGIAQGDTDGSAVRPGQPVRGNGELNEELGGETVSKPKPGTGKAVIHAKHGDNFIIPDDFVENEKFSVAEKFDGNLNALKTLITLLREKRPATPEEQKILFRYVGWGGIKDIVRNPDSDVEWQGLSDAMRERTRELYALVQEFESLTGFEGVLRNVKESRANAHYTSIPIIRGIYNLVAKAGFTGGRVLEPSMGVGHFFGAMPSEISKESLLFGTEIEPITATIAKYLYPSAKTKAVPYQNAGFPDEYFDMSISNVPFAGNVRITDKTFASRGLSQFLTSLHNYFIAKMIQQTRPGGLIVVVTSRFTMDAKSSAIRQFMNENTEFLGAYRLPNTAFRANANTVVVTDIILLRKLAPNEVVDNQNFLDSVEIEVDKEDMTGRAILNMNQYFVSNPDRVLGRVMAGERKMNAGEEELTVVDTGVDLEKALADGDIREGSYRQADSVDDIEAEAKTVEGYRSGQIVADGGEIFIVTDTALNEQTLAKPAKVPKYITPKQVEAYSGVRAAMEALYMSEYNSEDEAIVSENRRKLNELYDAYVSSYGYFSNSKSSWLTTNDIDGPKLLSLETPEPNGAYKKAKIFTERVIKTVAKRATSTNDINEAILASLSEHNKINMRYISRLMGLTEEEVLERAGELIFEDPTGGFLTRDQYLSGDVKTKLEEAKQALKVDPRFQRNVDALEKVIPEDLTIEQIKVNLGARWIDEWIYEAFIDKVLQVGASVSYSPLLDKYVVTGQSGTWNPINRDQYGLSSRVDGITLLEKAMNNVEHTVREGDPPVVMPAATEQARVKQQQLRDLFEEFVMTNSDVAKRIVTVYNEKFNRTVKRRYDGNHLSFPGYGWKYMLNQHQKDAAWMLLQNNGGIIDHIVGAGKTAVMAITVMEMRRLGIAKKPVIAALKANVGSIVNDFRAIYPNAKILAPTQADFSKKNRERFLMTIANNDYDVIIMTHEMLKFIPSDRQTEMETLEEQIEEIDAVLVAMIEDGIKPTQRDYKTIENRKAKLETRFRELSDIAKDNVLDFGAIGIDHLLVDESQFFKNLFYETRMTPQPAGLPSKAGSQRSLNMLKAVRYLQKLHGGDKGVTFLSGTPISNSLAEMYLLKKYLRPSWLKERGLNTFDAWANTFARVSRELEFTVTGTYNEKVRIRSFINVPEMAMAYNEVADVRTDENLQLDKPGPEGGSIQLKPVEMSSGQEAFMEILVSAASAAKTGNLTLVNSLLRGLIKPLTDDNKNSAMLLITSLAAKASLDMRLLGPEYEGQGGKIDTAVENVVSIYNDTTQHKGVQLIFSNLGTPKTGNEIHDLYQYFQEELGVPKADLDSLFGDIDDPNHRFPPKSKLLESVAKSEFEVQYSVLTPEKMEEYFEKSKEWSTNSYNVYQNVKDKLVAQGVPENEIAFIHDYDNVEARQELFAKTRAGEIRILLGSTQKLGTGVNVQDRIVAMHHLDIPWTPADMEQRNGRGLRQGNYIAKNFYNNVVKVYAYGTKRTLDAYKFQLLAIKQKFMNDIKSASVTEREVSEIDGEGDEAFDAMVAELSGNKAIFELEKIKNKFRKLDNERRNHLAAISRANDAKVRLQKSIESAKEAIPNVERDIAHIDAQLSEINPEEVLRKDELNEEDQRHDTRLKQIESEGAANKDGKFKVFNKLYESKDDAVRAEVERHNEAVSAIEKMVYPEDKLEAARAMLAISINGESVLGYKKIGKAFKQMLANSLKSTYVIKSKAQGSDYFIGRVAGMSIYAEFTGYSDKGYFNDTDGSVFEIKIYGSAQYSIRLLSDNEVTIGEKLVLFAANDHAKRVRETLANSIVDNTKQVEQQDEISKAEFRNKDQYEAVKADMESRQKEVAAAVAEQLRQMEIENGLAESGEEDIRNNILIGDHPTISQTEMDAFVSEHGDAISEMAASLGADIDIVANIADLPTQVAARMKPGKIYPAVYFNGRTYIIASGVKAMSGDPAEIIRRQVLHEVLGHKGIRAALGGANSPEFAQFMAMVWEAMPEEAKARLKRLYGEDADPALLADEYIARVAEKDMPEPSGWQKIITALKLAVSDFLRAIGINWAVTDADINVMLSKGRTELRRNAAANLQGYLTDNQVRDNIIGEIGAKALGGMMVRNLETAKAMEAAGAGPDEIRLRTGWEKQAGKWKTWLPPSLKVVKPVEIGETYDLADIIEFPELFAAYPQLKGLKVSVVRSKTILGRANIFDNNIEIGAEILSATYGQVHILLHELQHFIQEFEGFEQGTSSSARFAEHHYIRAAQIMYPESSLEDQIAAGRALFAYSEAIFNGRMALMAAQYPQLSEGYKKLEADRDAALNAAETGAERIRIWDQFLIDKNEFLDKARAAEQRLDKQMKDAMDSEQHKMWERAGVVIYSFSMGELEANNAVKRFFTRKRMAEDYINKGMSYADAYRQADADIANISLNEFTGDVDPAQVILLQEVLGSQLRFNAGYEMVLAHAFDNAMRTGELGFFAARANDMGLNEYGSKRVYVVPKKGANVVQLKSSEDFLDKMGLLNSPIQEGWNSEGYTYADAFENEIPFSVVGKGGFTGPMMDGNYAWYLAQKIVLQELTKNGAKVDIIHYTREDEVTPMQWQIINPYSVEIHETPETLNLKAPNGKPSNLTPEQWVAVRTPTFKNWFGDWENDPQNASKVVDENGEPLVVYHGSPNQFNVFDRQASRGGLREYGHFFSTNKKVAKVYGEYVTEAFLNLKKLKRFDAERQTNVEAWNKLEVDAGYKIANNRDAIEFLKEGRFGVERVDGVAAENIADIFMGFRPDADSVQDYLGTTYLVFDGGENNIKSANGNYGGYSTTDNDIRFSATDAREQQQQQLAYAWNKYVNASHLSKSQNQIAKEYQEVINAMVAIANQDGRIKRADTLAQVAADMIATNTGITNPESDPMLMKAAVTAINATRITPANRAIVESLMQKLPNTSIDELTQRINESQKLTPEQKEEMASYLETLLPASRLFGDQSRARPGQFLPADTDRGFRSKISQLATMADNWQLESYEKFLDYVSAFLGINFKGTAKEIGIREAYDRQVTFRNKVRELEIKESRSFATMPINLLQTELRQYAGWEEIAMRAMREKKALGMPYDDTYEMVEMMIAEEGPQAVHQAVNAMLQFMTADTLQDYGLFVMPLVEYYIKNGQSEQAEALTKQLTHYTVSAGRFIGSLNTIYQRLGRYGRAGRRMFMQKLFEQINAEAAIANEDAQQRISEYRSTLQEIQHEAAKMTLNKTKAENQKAADKIKGIIEKICKR